MDRVASVLQDPLRSVGMKNEDLETGLMKPRMDMKNPDLYVETNAHNVTHCQSSPNSPANSNAGSPQLCTNNTIRQGTRPGTNHGTNHARMLQGKSPSYGKRPQTSPAYQPAVGRAGPTFGGQGEMLEAHYRAHPSRAPPFNNFMIFIVDVEGAIRLEAAKTISELSEVYTSASSPGTDFT